MSIRTTAILDRIVAETREEVERRKRDAPIRGLLDASPRPRRRFHGAL